MKRLARRTCGGVNAFNFMTTMMLGEKSKNGGTMVRYHKRRLVTQ